jgi:peroxiredoxin
MVPSKKNRKTANLWKVLSPILIILAFVIAGLMFIKFEMTNSPRKSASTAIQVGATLPNFVLTRLDNTGIQISEVKAKVILLNFWATWCEACISEMPSIVQLRQKFRSQGFEALGVNLDENPEKAVPQITQQIHIDFPVFKDPDGKVADLFDVHAIPLTVIIDSQRKILFLRDGELNWNTPAIHSQIERWLSQ